MQSDNENTASSAESTLDSIESSKESTLEWLMELDRDEPEENLFDAETSFRDFMAQHDAETLEEIASAACGYATHVLGAEIFGRGDVLNLIKRGSGDTATREEGLRAFGILLNEGQIEKIRRGQFRLTRHSPYHRG